MFYCQYLYNWIGNKFLQLTSPSPYKYINNINQMTANVMYRGRRGRDRMVVGFTTTCAISAYHH
jgi:hypothetical protein